MPIFLPARSSEDLSQWKGQLDALGKVNGAEGQGQTHGPGTAPESVYEASMAGWRLAVRRFLVHGRGWAYPGLKAESRWLAAMQVRSFRSPAMHIF